MYKILFFLLFIGSYGLLAQEFNATVVVNAEQTAQPDLQVFKTMERAVTEFINNTKWTEVNYRTEERIECSFVITVLNFTNDSFSATLQLQSSRPVHGSNYKTPILNINDKQFNFSYLEFQPLNFNPNNFESNLISTIVFYLYTILGVDADTFELNSGANYYEQAKTIVGNAQGTGSLGWNRQDGNQTRYRLNDDLLSGTFDGYRKAMYTYHREGLDQMSTQLKEAKENIIKSLDELEEIHKTRPNSYIMRLFFDAKVDEISKILSGGPVINIADVKTLLFRIAPTYTKNWNEIEF